MFYLYNVNLYIGKYNQRLPLRNFSNKHHDVTCRKLATTCWAEIAEIHRRLSFLVTSVKVRRFLVCHPLPLGPLPSFSSQTTGHRLRCSPSQWHISGNDWLQVATAKAHLG